jgi:hypothetical protein
MPRTLAVAKPAAKRPAAPKKPAARKPAAKQSTARTSVPTRAKAAAKRPAAPGTAAKKPAARKPAPTSTKPAANRAAKPTEPSTARARTPKVVVVEPIAEVIPLPAPRPRRRSRAARAVAPVVLGSLTQPGARTGDGTCDQCGTERVTSLALVLTDGTPVRFTSCHACEHRSWLGPDGPLDRTTVLERTRKIR